MLRENPPRQWPQDKPIGVVSYKGRIYHHYITKEFTFPDGKAMRAKLGFLDGSKQFWVDASKISPVEPTPPPMESDNADEW